jgi:hypothetical protein
LPPAGQRLFGENLTTEGVDVNGAVIGARWRIGPRLVLQPAFGRIPCVTFGRKMGEPRWVKTFARVNRPGVYLRVLEPGEVGRRSGDRGGPSGARGDDRAGVSGVHDRARSCCPSWSRSTGCPTICEPPSRSGIGEAHLQQRTVLGTNGRKDAGPRDIA